MRRALLLLLSAFLLLPAHAAPPSCLDAVRELDLKVGSEVIAFVKSTEVSIAKL